ncbi:MAG: radical SAM protein [Bifidobacteriaceae bacterium]|jgi:pyruvate formate lyase activating enzyme|nr:radical SAM protein [Bifidobacteriaceae bacterium]
MPTENVDPQQAALWRAQGTAGLVFDIEEFALHDGPGLRTTVFLKGCPLRCSWCHNPEGIGYEPETWPDGRSCGVWWPPNELARHLAQHADVFAQTGGGITFSGGEPLAQAAFVTTVAQLLKPVHVALETSGQAPFAKFKTVVENVDLVLIDLKHPNEAVHRSFTGVGHERILTNLRWLNCGPTPFVARIPLIPGVNDSVDAMEGFASALEGATSLDHVELMPFNTLAGAKYAGIGRRFEPGFDVRRPVAVRPEAFIRRGIKWEVL